MSTERERKKFISEHAGEIAAVADAAVKNKLEAGEPLSRAQEGRALEEFETKVFAWERPLAALGAKSILFEAAEPAAYNTIEPLIERLQEDERCRKIMLVTDNISGKRFTEEQKSFSLEQIRKPDQPVMADVPGDADVVLAVIEPRNSPDKMLLYAGKSVYGNERTKTYFLADGLFGGVTRELLAGKASSHMDAIDGIFVPNELAQRLFESAVPEVRGRTIIVGSLLLQSLKENLIKNRTFEPHDAEEARRSLRGSLGMPDDTILVLYAGFPSAGLETLAEQPTTGNEETHMPTLNQEVFEKTLSAVRMAALQDPERTYALAIRTHPRASGIDNDLRVPSGLPENLCIVWVNAPEFTYDDIANAADIVACQGTSTEVFYAPYRGVATAIFDYAGAQERINENVFGADGVAELKKSEGSFFISSEPAFAEYLKRFRGRPERRPFPPDPIPHILDELLGETNQR